MLRCLLSVNYCE